MLERWLKSFSEIPLGQRLILLVAAGASLAVIAVTVLWAQKQDMEPLFGGLAHEDANAIVNRLRDAGVPYELSGGGTAILVPSTRVHEMRMQLAEDGLPSGGAVGFEIFDRSSYGTTDYVQKVNFRRALEGELSRTIGAMDQVRSARVHLVMPEKRLFATDQEAARASVTLKLSGSGAVSEVKVAGVVHLVASAVEGLSPENVTVVDLAGRVLYAGTGDAETRMVDSQSSYRTTLEDRLRQRVLDLLVPALGLASVEVQVAAELDFTRRETTEEMFDPDVSVVRSEQRSKEQTEGRSGGGEPGGFSSAAGEISQSNTSKNQNETINYELNKTVSHIVAPVGQVQRLSVAVLVDDPAVAGGEGTPRTEDEMAKYAALVKKAVGFDAGRGDSVEVVAIPFAGSAPMPEMVEPTLVEQLKPYAMPAVRYVLALLSIGMVIALVLRPLVKVVQKGGGGGNLPGRIEELVLADGLPKTVGELEESNQALFTDLDEAPVLPTSRGEILRMAKDNPRQTAEMLKSWIKENG